MHLLERQLEMDSLRGCLEAVRRDGRGRSVLVQGEAGIGKTSLLRAFVQALPTGTQVLAGGCEALFTPRPLGPLIDLASHLPPSLEQALNQCAPYNVLFPALLRFLRSAPAPRLLVIEDMHWADLGTIDLVRFLARRVHELPLLLVASFRPEALNVTHPLQRMLGDLPPSSTQRLMLQPLSRDAVDLLARAAQRPADALYDASRGNPFYLTVLLAADGDAVPASLRDAVLGTLARLSPRARQLACNVSLFPGHAELAVLRAMGALGDDAESHQALEECLRAAMLEADARVLAFRHDIARTVVHDAMPSHERIRGHALALRAYGSLPAGADDVARRIHHAEAAGRVAEAAALAPRAASRAAAIGDHHEAARLLALALRDMQPLSDAVRAGLLERWSDALSLTHRHRQAIEAREAALALRMASADRLRQGMNQRLLARLCWLDSGAKGPGLSWAEQAIQTLSALPASRELALAYSTMSHLCLVSGDMSNALAWGLNALEQAETVDDAQAMSDALNNVACTLLRQRNDAVAWERLTRSLQLALQHGFVADAARAYNNLFILSVVHHEFDAALRWAEQGLAFCDANGLDLFTVRIGIRRAFARIVMGEWAGAAQELAEIGQRHTPAPRESATLDFVASLLAMRRGEAQAPQRLQASVAAMHEQRVEVWFITTAAARAEWAWLQGDFQAAQEAARSDLGRLLAAGDVWRAGELAAWLQRSGGSGLPPLPAGLPKPYAHELAGRWREAADAWATLGCPYNQALALCVGDAAAQAEALALFDGLGARSAAARVRELLRARGVRKVPRGLQARTRDDPLQLTARERQIFEWLRRGASNSAIAAQLHRSERTIEHHVSALLRKLGLRSRVELLTRHPPPTDPEP